MVGRGSGVFGVTGFCAIVLFAGQAAAQSTASFPESPGNTPPTPVHAPSPSVVVTPPAAIPNAPASVKPPVVTPAADSATESRYPTLPSEARALPSVQETGIAFYPAILPYREGLPVPPGYHVEHRAANGLIAGGVTTLVIGYITAVVVGAGDSFTNGNGWLVVPVVGPWAAIGARSYHCDNDPLKAQQCIRGAFNEVQTIAILSADAVVQATGAVLFLAGLGSGRDELVRTGVETGFRLTPRTLGNHAFGVGFDGRF